MKKLIYIFILLIPVMSFSQSEAKLIRKGNKDYKVGDYKAAEIKYRKSLEKNDKSVKGEFNLADALYEQEDYDNATKLFQDLAKKELAPTQKAEVYHNLGNSFLESEKYQESIEAYKNALRNNPTDMDSKYNLEYARKKLEEQQQQDQKDQQEQQDQNQDQKDQEDQQDKQDQKDNDQKDNDQDQQNKDQQQNDDQNQQDQKNQKSQQPKISKKDAERMLSALKNDEKKTIEKIKKEKAKAAKASKTEKDW